MTAADDDDAAGYKRPPKAFRWKKGQCGNSGRQRRRAVKGTVAIIDELFAKRLKIIGNGSARKRSGLDLIVMQLLKKEAAGDRRATAVLHKYETAFPLGQNASRDILLISEPEPQPPGNGETRRKPEGRRK